MGIKSITTKTELKNYIFEMLGLQLHKVILTEEQLDYIIDNALQRFFDVSQLGVEERFISLDVTVGTQNYELPYEVQAVVEVINADNLMDFFSIERTVTDMAVTQKYHQVRLLDIEVSRQYIQTVRNQLLKEISFDFNSITKKIHFFTPPKQSMSYVLRVYRVIDEADATLDFAYIYGHPWIKAYVEALSWCKFGENLMMYADSPLPGGMKVNSTAILTKGETWRDKLEEELIYKYQMPFGFLVG